MAADFEIDWAERVETETFRCCDALMRELKDLNLSTLSTAKSLNSNKLLDEIYRLILIANRGSIILGSVKPFMTVCPVTMGKPGDQISHVISDLYFRASGLDAVDTLSGRRANSKRAGFFGYCKDIEDSLSKLENKLKEFDEMCEPKNRTEQCVEVPRKLASVLLSGLFSIVWRCIAVSALCREKNERGKFAREGLFALRDLVGKETLGTPIRDNKWIMEIQLAFPQSATVGAALIDCDHVRAREWNSPCDVVKGSISANNCTMYFVLHRDILSAGKPETSFFYPNGMVFPDPNGFNIPQVNERPGVIELLQMRNIDKVVHSVAPLARDRVLFENTGSNTIVVSICENLYYTDVNVTQFDYYNCEVDLSNQNMNMRLFKKYSGKLRAKVVLVDALYENVRYFISYDLFGGVVKHNGVPRNQKPSEKVVTYFANKISKNKYFKSTQRGRKKRSNK